MYNLFFPCCLVFSSNCIICVDIVLSTYPLRFRINVESYFISDLFTLTSVKTGCVFPDPWLFRRVILCGFSINVEMPTWLSESFRVVINVVDEFTRMSCFTWSATNLTLNFCVRFLARVQVQLCRQRSTSESQQNHGLYAFTSYHQITTC